MSDVISYLLGRNIAFLVLPHAGAVTPADTARAHAVDLSDVVRTEVVTGAARPCLMVVPYPLQLDLELARTALRDPSAHLATDAETREIAPSCDIGAIPPLSLYLMVPMYVDRAVADREQMIFPAGRPSVLVAVQRAELLRDDPHVAAPLTRESRVPGSAIAPSRRLALADEGLQPIHLARDQTGTPPADE